MQSARLFVCIVAITFMSSVLSAGDWTQWRGPNGSNAVDAQPVPTEWSSSKNIVWKADVPGRGHSTPIVTGNVIVLLTADNAAQTQGVVAFDRATGKQLWMTPISQGGFAPIHAKNTFASSTPATDGKFIYACFCHHEKIELVALDLEGKIIWRRDAGAFRPKVYEYGYASSPTIYKGTVIVSADCDTIAWLKAFRLSDGEVAWEQERPLMLNWGSPIVANIGGRDQLFLSGTNMIASYDPANGQPLWNTPCLTMATCGTCIWEDGVVFASGGYPGKETVAVKADGSGVLWKNGVKSYEQSMLVHKGYVYAFSDEGIAYCWDAKTGKEMWKQRLRGPVSASPLLVGDLIYATNEDGTTWVFKASPEKYELVSRNQLEDAGFASLIALDGQLFIRTAKVTDNAYSETLYCVGSK